MQSNIILDQVNEFKEYMISVNYSRYIADEALDSIIELSQHPMMLRTEASLLAMTISRNLREIEAAIKINPDKALYHTYIENAITNVLNTAAVIHNNIANRTAINKTNIINEKLSVDSITVEQNVHGTLQELKDAIYEIRNHLENRSTIL